MSKGNGHIPLVGPDGKPLQVRGEDLTATTLDPQKVADRFSKRDAHEFEEASQRCFRTAQFGMQCKWPKNITDDLLLYAVLLGEVYIAFKEGIIKHA